MAAEPDFSYTQANQHTLGAGATRAPPLSDEEREQLKQELQKTESEIATLRMVLQTRVKEAQDLKRRLGLSPWGEFADDVNQGLSKMKQSDAYHRTNELLQNATDKVSQTLGQIKGSSAFKSFEGKIGSAYGSVKYFFQSKISSSTSSNFDPAMQGTEAMPTASAPQTPSTEKSHPKK